MRIFRPSPITAPAAAFAFALSCALSAPAVIASCSLPPATATLWTNVPEFAQYAEAFNQVSPAYRVDVEFRRDLTQALSEERVQPAFVAGTFIKNARARARLRPSDHLFADRRVLSGSFYPDLLASGRIDGRQYLVPASFNLPAVAFSRDGIRTQDPVFMELSEIRDLSGGFNRRQEGGFVRMGFSPRWDPAFLLVVANLEAVDFREGKPLSWNDGRLNAALRETRAWVGTVNGSTVEEDDFQFKYLFNPGYRSVSEGRILFSYEPSDRFFLLPDEKRRGLDYRWVGKGGRVSIEENNVDLALATGRGRRAAEAFMSWFCREETQKTLLEQSKAWMSMDVSFGIAGGFSSLKRVNEKYFPAYYPALLGHLPPAAGVSGVSALPRGWTRMKTEVVQPSLLESVSRGGMKAQSAGAADSGDKAPQLSDSAALKARLSAWMKENPGL